MAKLFERRLAPLDSPAATLAATAAAFLAAMLATALLFLSYGANPLHAYFALIHEPFATLRGFGYSLVRASPLTLIALGTIVSWRSGFNYLGFEGCFVLGASAAAAISLATPPGANAGHFHLLAFLVFTGLGSFVAGGIWAGLVGFVRTRLGGSEVLISLMANYVAIFALQFLVSGPLRAPGSLPETPLLARTTWLPFILPGTRAHAGILVAVAAAGLVWVLLRKTTAGYEMIVTGFNPAAARYAGIPVGRRVVLAAFLAGGLGGLAGMTEVLGSQHRLMDGISGGVGFVGVIVALLARLNPLAVVPTALLYGAVSVGADAMQRRASIPSAITFVLESMVVLFVLVFDALRFYRVNVPWRGREPLAATPEPEGGE